MCCASGCRLRTHSTAASGRAGPSVRCVRPCEPERCEQRGVGAGANGGRARGLDEGARPMARGQRRGNCGETRGRHDE